MLVIEAGPDYGPYADGRWPNDLLDPRVIPRTHQWGYASTARFGLRDLPLERAKVIGGCSAHNGMAAIGYRHDYDGWAAAGNEGWDTASLLPHFIAASARLRVLTPARQDLGPFHEAVLDASARRHSAH